MLGCMSWRTVNGSGGADMFTRYLPWFRWFAWRPVDTDDRGWVWLRMVWKRREIHAPDGIGAFRTWAYVVGEK